MDKETNPESLHNVGQGNGSKTNPSFVNNGTPEKPLATMASTTNPEVSTAASQALRDGLTK